MGLGKTKQALTVARFFADEWPLLCICPSSVCYNMSAECTEELGIKKDAICVLNGKTFDPAWLMAAFAGKPIQSKTGGAAGPRRSKTEGRAGAQSVHHLVRPLENGARHQALRQPIPSGDRGRGALRQDIRVGAQQGAAVSESEAASSFLSGTPIEPVEGAVPELAHFGPVCVWGVAIHSVHVWRKEQKKPPSKRLFDYRDRYCGLRYEMKRGRWVPVEQNSVRREELGSIGQLRFWLRRTKEILGDKLPPKIRAAFCCRRRRSSGRRGRSGGARQVRARHLQTRAAYMPFTTSCRRSSGRWWSFYIQQQVIDHLDEKVLLFAESQFTLHKCEELLKKNGLVQDVDFILIEGATAYKNAAGDRLVPRRAGVQDRPC